MAKGEKVGRIGTQPQRQAKASKKRRPPQAAISNLKSQISDCPAPLFSARSLAPRLRLQFGAAEQLGDLDLPLGVAFGEGGAQGGRWRADRRETAV
jgi:hypothetical protein